MGQIKDLKKELDKWVSLFVRLTYANDNGFVCCYTCDKISHYKNMHCGHFVSRGKLATRFDMRNMRPQCPGCNLFGGGKPDVFALKLTSEYGDGIIKELYQLSNKITKYFPYEEKIEFYKKEVKELLLQKHL